MATPTEELQLEPGQQVGGYRLEGMMGRGGMGVVYKALQENLGRHVALKVLHPKRLGRQDAIDKFLQEARLAAGLSHPRLVQVLDVGYDGNVGLYYYSMQLVVARTLTVLIQQDGPLGWDRAARLLAQAADGMAHAHARGLVHRDLKPDNLLIDANDNVMITDLGLALDSMVGRETGSKRLLCLVGTPEFSAPEQLRHPDRATPASDVFSLGGILYFMLTGAVPFSGESLLDLVIAVAVDEPRLLHELVEPAHGLLCRLLDKRADQRPADGQAVLDLLRGIVEGRRSSGTRGFTRSTSRFKRRRRPR
jgi:serine/threonine protein kinase